MRLSKRNRVIQLDRSGGTLSFVFNGVRCWFSSHLTLTWGDTLPEALFIEDDLVCKIPASVESSWN